MEVFSLTKNSQWSSGSALSASRDKAGEGKFSTALNTATQEEKDGGGAAELPAESDQTEKPADPRELREQRLQRFGSYAAYSLWRNAPATAAGITDARPDSHIDAHGLQEFSQNKREHFQGIISGMSSDKHAATGTRALDQSSAATTGGQPEGGVLRAVANSSDGTGAPERNQHSPAESTPPHMVAGSSDSPDTAAAADSGGDGNLQVNQETAPISSKHSGESAGQPTATSGQAPPIETKSAETSPDAVVGNSDEATAGQVSVGLQNAGISAPVEAKQTPADLRAERLERFGSYTAYSLWRKIPAMAAGIVEPKSDSHFQHHGLLDYWHNKRDHFQGQVQAMDPAARAASGTRLLDQDNVVNSAAEHVSDAADPASAAPLQSTPTVRTASPGSEAAEFGNGSPGGSDSAEAQAPAQAEIGEATAAPVDVSKSPADIRAERLERFGSYTAYSLWRKIPAMAAGIVEAKPDSHFEEHGLLEYWQNKRDHFQGQIREMSEAERSAAGVRLLDDGA